MGRKKVVMNIDEILLELTARNDSWRDAIYEMAEINNTIPDFVEEIMNQSYSDCLRDIAKALGKE
jgi:hypothetical protein